MIRLNKYIASSGFCSRRRADELIKNGKVFINGKIIENMGYQVDEVNDIVTIDGNKISLETKKVYIMLNKPTGYITTNDEQLGRKCTNDLIKEDVRVFPIGRLDMNSEGLLLLTNDGEFSNNLMHPSKKIQKTYIVKLNKKITDEKIDLLEKGVDIGGYITQPAEIIKKSNNVIEITISEGKNRQIRRMCESVGLKVIKLRRIKIGTLELGNLSLGRYRYLSKKEIKKLIEN
jgi:23S rRNA pseudouridine2605 synthase